MQRANSRLPAADFDDARWSFASDKTVENLRLDASEAGAPALLSAFVEELKARYFRIVWRANLIQPGELPVYLPVNSDQGTARGPKLSMIFEPLIVLNGGIEVCRQNMHTELFK